MNENTNSQWTPDRKDVETLARKVCELLGLNPNESVTAYRPAQTIDGVWVVPHEDHRMPHWCVFGNHVHAVLYALHEQGRLFPPPAEPEPDNALDEVEHADVVSIDLSDLKAFAPPERETAEQLWRRGMGL